jgi:hypothetical protein
MREIFGVGFDFRTLCDGKRFQVVHLVLPMDLLGVYVIFPE